MTTEEKLHKILGWYADVCDEATKQLAIQENFSLINEIEKMVGEPKYL